jgi:hypothetical protein
MGAWISSWRPAPKAEADAGAWHGKERNETGAHSAFSQADKFQGNAVCQELIIDDRFPNFGPRSLNGRFFGR